jgi:general secretion pathway protein L
MSIWLGVDIGRAAVKVAVIRSAYRKTSLEKLVVVEIQSGLPPAGATPGSDPTSAIRSAVTVALGGGVPGDGIAVAIEGSRAAVRTLMLPASAQKQIADVLPFELEAELPFEISESVFDYRVLASKANAVEGAELSVLVALARTADVRAQIDLVKGASGVEPERVGVGAFPLANLAPYVAALTEEGPIAIVDLGSMESEVVVLQASEPVFARTLSWGTEGLPETAQRLAREIRTSIAAFRATGGAVPTKVYLCGGGAFVSGAASFLSSWLDGIPVEELPPPALDTTALDPAQKEDLPRFAKAIGLALGLSGRGAGLDLRKGPLSYERGFAWVRDKIPMLAGLGAVIAVSFFFSAWAQLHGQTIDREVLEKSLAAASKDVLGEETTSAARATELLTAQTSVNDEDPMPHVDAFDVMVKLSEDIPQSMTHDIEELDVQKAHVVVHGIVGSIPDAQSIAAALTSEKCFADVKITRTNQVPGGERQKYVLEFDEKCPEDVKGAKKKKDADGASSAAPNTTGGK